MAAVFVCLTVFATPEDFLVAPGSPFAVVSGRLVASAYRVLGGEPAAPLISDLHANLRFRQRMIATLLFKLSHWPLQLCSSRSYAASIGMRQVIFPISPSLSLSFYVYIYSSGSETRRFQLDVTVGFPRTHEQHL